MTQSKKPFWPSILETWIDTEVRTALKQSQLGKHDWLVYVRRRPRWP
jgi:hypothetical protein